MLIRLAIIVAAAGGAAIAGYVMWWASHRSGLLNLFAGVILGLIAVALALLIGLVMVWSTSLF
jgi:hypothetical protein